MMRSASTKTLNSGTGEPSRPTDNHSVWIPVFGWAKAGMTSGYGAALMRTSALNAPGYSRSRYGNVCGSFRTPSQISAP